MRKLATMLLILVLAASGMAIFALADTVIAESSAPRLTVRLVDRSYDVPVTQRTSTNPYTGQQETTTEGGYHVDNRTIELTIKNPPLNGDRDWLYYNVRVKGHFIQNWTTLYGREGSSGQQVSNSDYTTIIFLSKSHESYREPWGGEIIAPSGGKIDIQVAVFEKSVETYGDPHVQFGWGYRYVFTQLSDWSNIQTLSVDDCAVTNTEPQRRRHSR